MAIALEFQMDPPFRVYAEQLDAAAMQAETRFHFLDGIAHPRFEIKRMEPMQEEQTGNDLVAAEFVDHGRATDARIVDHAQDLFEPGAMELEQGLNEFADLLADALVGRAFQRRN